MSTVRTEPHGQHTVYVLEDAAAGSSARVLADFGFNCYSFQCRIGGHQHELIVTWPGGGKQSLRDVEANQTLRVRQAEGGTDVAGGR